MERKNLDKKLILENAQRFGFVSKKEEAETKEPEVVAESTEEQPAEQPAEEKTEASDEGKAD